MELAFTIVGNNQNAPMSVGEIFVFIAASAVLLYLAFLYLNQEARKSFIELENKVERVLGSIDKNWILIRGNVDLTSQNLKVNLVGVSGKARPFALLKKPDTTFFLFESSGYQQQPTPEDDATILVIEVSDIRFPKLLGYNRMVLNRHFQSAAETVGGIKFPPNWDIQEHSQHNSAMHPKESYELVRSVYSVVDNNTIFAIETAENQIAVLQLKHDGVTRFEELVAIGLKIVELVKGAT